MPPFRGWAGGYARSSEGMASVPGGFKLPWRALGSRRSTAYIPHEAGVGTHPLKWRLLTCRPLVLKVFWTCYAAKGSRAMWRWLLVLTVARSNEVELSQRLQQATSQASELRSQLRTAAHELDGAS